jgi:ribosomal protein S18 acetylase RimI-like enzyme
MTELERCIAFLREIDRRAAGRQVPFRFGTAYLRDELPSVWSRNYLSLEHDLDEATAELLAAEAERVLGEAGVAHRKIEVFDAGAGERLAPGFAKLGWQVECDVVMVAARATEGEADLPVAEEVTHEELVGVWAEANRSEGHIDDEDVIHQLAEGKRVLASAIDVRLFGARADGEIGAYCELYSLRGTGQIENVLTLERHRNRGLARALVLQALATSRAAGNDLTFLLANRDDWPKELYRKLVFAEVGLIFDFVIPPPEVARGVASPRQ